MTEPHYKKQASCRLCGNPLETILDLGNIYPSAFLAEGEAEPARAPLTLARCTLCGLVQLHNTLDLDLMYRHYYYQSGINSSMAAALKNVVEEALRLVDLKAGGMHGVVCDIACNDGTLLSYYPEDVVRIGFDPALNLPKPKHINVFINDYFSAAKFPYTTVKAKIITSLAMFYDLPDPIDFTQQVKSILDEDGIWIIQLSDLKSMIETNALDCLCHEHLEYYSVDNIMNIMTFCDLEIFRIEHNEVNGGSLRFYVAHRNKREVEPSVNAFVKADRRYLQSPEGSILAFRDRIADSKRRILAWLIESYLQGKRIYGLAASTKGNTLLQAYGIDSRFLPKIGDLNAEKFGKHTVGTNIPIVSEAQAVWEKPDAFLVMAWHFLPHFLKTMLPYMETGGVLVVPLPEPRVYRLNAENEVYSEPLVVEAQYGD